MSTTRGASFLPGRLPKPKAASNTRKKPFDVKEWHRKKAAESAAAAKRARQIETCYRQHVPPQVQYGPSELNEREQDTARLMRENRSVGL